VTGRLLTERRGHVAILTLSNPAKRNALDPPLCEALADAVRGLADDGARAAVLTGEGDRAFCAGFDVTALPTATDLAAAANNPFDPVIEAMVANDVPIVCALNGGAFGGGCEVAATCDLRVAHAGVELAIPPAKLGIIYATRGLARLAAIAGESRAREMFLTAGRIGAEQAERWGLIDRLVAPAEVLGTAVELAERMASLAPLAVQGMRRGFEALLARRIELDAEVAGDLGQRRLRAWTSQDSAAARVAFLRKGKPEFKGR